MLLIDNLSVRYGALKALDQISFTIPTGECLAVLGHNGAGRSTLAKAIMGLISATGRVQWQGQDLRGWPPQRIAQQGLGYVPEQRQVFGHLSVLDNLRLAQFKRHVVPPTLDWGLDSVWQHFPRLWTCRQTQAGVLSGGEQQMLSLARSLMGRPDCLILDEISEGLSPQVITMVTQCLHDLQHQGLTLLMIEQNPSLTQDLATQTLRLERGQKVETT